jgi:hypothetical protein
MKKGGGGSYDCGNQQADFFTRPTSSVRMVYMVSNPCLLALAVDPNYNDGINVISGPSILAFLASKSCWPGVFYNLSCSHNTWSPEALSIQGLSCFVSALVITATKYSYLHRSSSCRG